MLAHWPLTKAGQLKAAHACLRAQCSGGKEGAPRTALLRLSGGKERRERGKGRKLICSAEPEGNEARTDGAADRTAGMAHWRAGPTTRTAATTELVSGEGGLSLSLSHCESHSTHSWERASGLSSNSFLASSSAGMEEEGEGRTTSFLLDIFNLAARAERRNRDQGARG